MMNYYSASSPLLIPAKASFSLFSAFFSGDDRLYLAVRRSGRPLIRPYVGKAVRLSDRPLV